ncbi:MAG: TetR family transcriptional regulator C-terminal domain-containing protein [Actinomycetota bacterium]
MPRQVDHGARRREIIDALGRLATREGLSAVTFRTLAAEADVSVRRIQYYFGDKAALLSAALQAVGEEGFARSLTALAAAGPDVSVRDLLSILVRVGLPLDDESRRIALLFHSFHVAAITDEALATTEAREVKQWTVPFVSILIGQARDGGGTRDGIDPDHEAVMLMAAFDGLTLDLLAGTRTAQDALAAIDYQLDRIFTDTSVVAVLPDPAQLSPAAPA